MSKPQSVVSEVLASGILGGGVGAALSVFTNKEKFKNSYKPKTDTTDEELLLGFSVGVGIFVLLLVILILVLAIVFLVAIYKMMPSYKALHTIMSFFIGAVWYIPALIYYCVVNDYTLMLPSVAGSAGMNIGAMNNRSRNGRYL